MAALLAVGVCLFLVDGEGLHSQISQSKDIETLKKMISVSGKLPFKQDIPIRYMSKTRLQENIAGLLCYVLGWVSGIIFLLLEKDNKFVRFHAVQSIIVFGAISVLWLIFIWLPFVYWIVYALAFILWVVLMVKAYQGEKYKLPWVGDIAEKQVK